MANEDCMPEPRSSPDLLDSLFDPVEHIVVFDPRYPLRYPYAPTLHLGPDVLLRAAFLPGERLIVRGGKGIILAGNPHSINDWLDGYPLS